MPTEAGWGNRELTDEQQRLLRELESLVRGNPAAVMEAANRLSRAISDRTVWAERSAEYEHERSARPETAGQAPDPRAYFPPDTDTLRPYWMLLIVARDRLIATSEPHRPFPETAWDIVIVVWLLTTPDAPLADHGLASVAAWDGQRGWSRSNILREELSQPEIRAMIFTRVSIAIEEIRLARNPLLAAALNEPKRPPDIQRLFEALILVECASSLLARTYGEAVDLWQKYGPPKPIDFPDQAELRKKQALSILAESRNTRHEDGEQVSYYVATTMWADLLGDLERAYQSWCGYLDTAIKAVPASANALDGQAGRSADRWTAGTLSELRELMSLFHPMNLGADGMGMVRSKPRPLPERFVELVRAIRARRATLHDVTGSPRAKSRSGSEIDCRHGSDFTWVVWYGTHYEFSKGNQAATVGVLWAEWDRSGRRDGCGLSDATVAESIGAAEKNFRVKMVFRDHPAFTKMIREVGKGVHALCGPGKISAGRTAPRVSRKKPKKK